MDFPFGLEEVTAQNELDLAKAAQWGPHSSPEAAAAAALAVQTAQEKVNTIQRQSDESRTASFQRDCTERQAVYNSMNPHKKGE